VIVENGAFILSLSIGNELPFMVNLGVLLDVLVSVFLLAIFINKVGDVTGDGDVTHLNKLKD
jgi:hydrogenase-4 component E